MTESQREHFAARGFVRLPGVFSRDAAAAMEQRVWEWLERHHGMRRDDPASWTLVQPTGLQPLRHQAVFEPNGGALLLEALDELLGAGGWKRPREWGGFLVSFPSAGETRARAPWHTDFDYRGPSDRVFGALVFSYLSDVPAGGGGTLAVAGSHRVIRRFVEGRPRSALAPMKTVRLALMHSDPWLAAARGRAERRRHRPRGAARRAPRRGRPRRDRGAQRRGRRRGDRAPVAAASRRPEPW